MPSLEAFLQSFNELKNKAIKNEDDFEEREFYFLIDQIKNESEYLFEQAQKHPKYDFAPTPDVPDSMTLDSLQKLHIEIQRFIDKAQPFDTKKIYDDMAPNRHDDDFDEDSMNFDSIFGGD